MPRTAKPTKRRGGKSLQICHVITTISRGGAENQLLILAKLQVLQGDKVTIVPLKGNLELMESFLRIGAEVDLTLYRKNFIAQVRTFNFSQQLKFDIVHCHLPQAELLLAFTLRKRPIITRHFGGAFYPNRNKFLSLFLSNFASRKSTAVIAISKSVNEYLSSSKEILKPSKIRVVEYGFCVKTFLGDYQVKKSRFEINAGQLHFGTLARLSPEKDLKTLINASSLLSGELDLNLQVKIFGDGPIKHDLERQILDLGVQDKVSLCGRTMNPVLTLSKFDVFVLTSQFEGFGMVLLEAMSIGLPIICSRIPSSVEILGETGAAIFFEPGNPIDLSNKMRNVQTYLATNYQAEQAKRLDLYASEVMLAKINTVYRESLAKHDSSDITE